MTEIPRNLHGFLRPIEYLPESLTERERELLTDTTRILTHAELGELGQTSTLLLLQQEREAEGLAEKRLYEQYYQTLSPEERRPMKGLASGLAKWWSRRM